MGREAEVLVKHDGLSQVAMVQLETDVLHVRFEHRISVWLSQITRCADEDGWLRIEYGKHHLDLHLGKAAERWHKAIVSPPSLTEKLGAKPGLSMAAIGFDDRSFLNDLPHAATLAHGDAHDLVLLNAMTPDDLDEVPKARRATAERGGLWIVYPRGSKEIPERLVRMQCCTDDWVDVKTCRFDDTRTALKFVRRRA